MSNATPDRTIRDRVIQAVAESQWGEGCYPFNAATGWEIRYVSETVADAVLAALERRSDEQRDT